MVKKCFVDVDGFSRSSPVKNKTHPYRQHVLSYSRSIQLGGVCLLLVAAIIAPCRLRGVLFNLHAGQFMSRCYCTAAVCPCGFENKIAMKNWGCVAQEKTQNVTSGIILQDRIEVRHDCSEGGHLRSSFLHPKTRFWEEI